MAYPLSWSWRADLLARGTQCGLYLFATETLLLLGSRSDDHRSVAPRVRDAGGSQLRGYSRPERDRICFLFLAGLPVVAPPEKSACPKAVPTRNRQPRCLSQPATCAHAPH